MLNELHARQLTDLSQFAKNSSDVGQSATERFLSSASVSRFTQYAVAMTACVETIYSTSIFINDVRGVDSMQLRVAGVLIVLSCLFGLNARKAGSRKDYILLLVLPLIVLGLATAIVVAYTMLSRRQ